MQWAQVWILLAHLNLLQQAVGSAKENKALQGQDIYFIAMVIQNLLQVAGTLHVAAESFARELVFDHFHLGIIDHKQHDGHQKTEHNSLQKTNGADHDQDQCNYSIICFLKFFPGIVEPLHKKLKSQVQQQPSQNHFWENR